MTPRTCTGSSAWNSPGKNIKWVAISVLPGDLPGRIEPRSPALAVESLYWRIHQTTILNIGFPSYEELMSQAPSSSTLSGELPRASVLMDSQQLNSNLKNHTIYNNMAVEGRKSEGVKRARRRSRSGGRIPYGRDVTAEIYKWVGG